MDQVLHPERVGPGQAKVTWRAVLAALADGCFVRGADGGSYLVGQAGLFPWSWQGYGAPLPRRARAVAEVLTPRAIVAVLSAGYGPMLHPTATRGLCRQGDTDRP
jgi:hypothetical protein